MGALWHNDSNIEMGMTKEVTHTCSLVISSISNTFVGREILAAYVNICVYLTAVFLSISLNSRNRFCYLSTL